MLDAPPDTLIIVCCHAIYFGVPHSPTAESSWLIEPFQSDEVPTFIAHIKAGMNQLQNHGDRALLCFSGGRTKQDRTMRSEARSYLEAAQELGLLEDLGKLEERIVCDEWATNSFQNIMCPLKLWPRWAKKVSKCDAEDMSGEKVNDFLGKDPEWPRKLVIVSHKFKRRRFLELHLPALEWNGEVDFVGIDPPFEEKKMKEIVEGDAVRGYGAWKDDLFGQGEVLRKKREKRGWDQEAFAGYVESWEQQQTRE